METKKPITITTDVRGNSETIWTYWTKPEHIKQWNTASPDWHTTHAENDVREGGRFTSRMEAKDGSFGFDFSGTYTKVIPYKHISYTLEDDRKVSVEFEETGSTLTITETFEPENENPVAIQRDGWQAILHSFKQYVALQST